MHLHTVSTHMVHVGTWTDVGQPYNISKTQCNAGGGAGSRRLGTGQAAGTQAQEFLKERDMMKDSRALFQAVFCPAAEW